MSLNCTAEVVSDLLKTKHLRIFDLPVHAELEIAAVLRQVYRAGGPAILFTRVVDCDFPVVGNLYGSPERARHLLRHGLRRVEKAMKLKGNPGLLWRRPWQYLELAASLPHLFPRRVRHAPSLARAIPLSKLPRFVSWQGDGGPFITLPQVYSEHPDQPGWLKSNLGMYRIQLAGNDYVADREVGLHYQIHRGIGIHHQAALARGQKLWVNIFVGGPPALTWAAVMPLPEQIPELVFAGALAGRPVGLAKTPLSPLPVVSEADFVIVGWIDPTRTRPEGPFGDHLGYYSLRHDFPVLQVEGVFHRPGAIWPVTTVGRPPQEDTTFGKLIHELTDPVLPTVLPGVKQVHAVDAAGVHPLLLAIGSERYTPYQKRRRPQELLTNACAILGQGQLSLAKYLLIVAQEDDPTLDCRDTRAFFQHFLRRVDWRRDLHFHTESTIDTLDYSGGEMHRGSKLVAAAVGEPVRELPTEGTGEGTLPPGFKHPRVCLPGILTLTGPNYIPPPPGQPESSMTLLEGLPLDHPLGQFPLWVIAEEGQNLTSRLEDFLWVTFTRSNPAADIYGVAPFTTQRHWGCRGPLLIDARPKPHHAPELQEDPALLARVQSWACRGGPLHGIL